MLRKTSKQNISSGKSIENCKAPDEKLNEEVQAPETWSQVCDVVAGGFLILLSKSSLFSLKADYLITFLSLLSQLLNAFTKSFFLVSALTTTFFVTA